MFYIKLHVLQCILLKWSWQYFFPILSAAWHLPRFSKNVFSLPSTPPLHWYQLTEREQGPWRGQPQQPGLPGIVESPKKCQARSEISFPSNSALQFTLNIQQMSVTCDLSLGRLLTFAAFCFVPFSPVRQWFCKACWPAYWGAWRGLVQSRQQWSPCEKSLQIISSVRNSDIF